MPGFAYDHIFLPQTGIRLIDVGISALRTQVGDRLFERFVAKEVEELKEFKDFFLSK